MTAYRFPKDIHIECFTLPGQCNPSRTFWFFSVARGSVNLGDNAILLPTGRTKTRQGISDWIVCWGDLRGKCQQQASEPMRWVKWYSQSDHEKMVIWQQPASWPPAPTYQNSLAKEHSLMSKPKGTKKCTRHMPTRKSTGLSTVSGTVWPGKTVPVAT